MALAGCADEAPPWAGDPLAEPQATSLLGEPLYAIADTTGEIAGADAALAEAPDDVELLIAAARVRWDYQQYRQAIAMYTRAMELAPDDWRPHAFRGIRQFSVRELDGAIADLERARELAPSSYDVAYYLGVVYLVAGRFDEAADEFLRCMDASGRAEVDENMMPGYRGCSAYANDLESRIALTEWAVRALLRAGRTDEAERLLDGVDPDLHVRANLAYYHDLLFYKGLMSEDEILNPAEPWPYSMETVEYGIASWYLVQGDTARALDLLGEAAANPRWNGYGRTGAEADLMRLSEGAAGG